MQSYLQLSGIIFNFILLCVFLLYIYSIIKSPIKNITKRYNDFCIGINFGFISPEIQKKYLDSSNNSKINEDKREELIEYLDSNIKKIHQWIPFKISNANKKELENKFQEIMK